MIKAYCTTNIDEYKNVVWPTNFVIAPRVGDYVRGAGGQLQQPVLRVVAVTHCYSKSQDQPFLSIELHR